MPKGCCAMPRSLSERILNRARCILLRLNRHNILSRRLRVMIYRDLCGMKVGGQTDIWAGNRFNVADSVTIGRNTIVGPCNVFLARGGMTIGDHVNLSGFSYFISQAHDARGANFNPTVFKPVIIENHVWVATHAMIMPGVKLGQGCVVAAGAVVTKNVEPFTIVAGNPARVIGQRDPKVVEQPLKTGVAMQWL